MGDLGTLRRGRRGSFGVAAHGVRSEEGEEGKKWVVAPFLMLTLTPQLPTVFFPVLGWCLKYPHIPGRFDTKRGGINGVFFLRPLAT